jgi:FMN phosphatase YigB (HAD superfamily)
MQPRRRCAVWSCVHTSLSRSRGRYRCAALHVVATDRKRQLKGASPNVCISGTVSGATYVGTMTTTARPKIGLLIVDLDDTLWTWFDAWHKSFTAMLNTLTATTGLAEHELLPAIKAVHEQKGTAEYSWLLDELEVLKPFSGGRSAAEAFDPVLHAQNSARKHNTRLYPGVLTTLRHVRNNGVKIVAYTESLSFWTEWRMRQTGLDGIIDILYSSPDHDFPEGETRETVRTLPAEEYGLKQTVHLNVARGIAKPDPQVLQQIVSAHEVPGRSTVYVGDSLDRDVEMAQRVGVIGVHAKYGEAYEKPGYDLLRAVTHWKPAAVEKEKSRDPQIKAKADYVLQEGFYELLVLFDFATPINVDAHLQLWKESVGVQMHFNDLGWRIRALALTVLTFTLGAIGFAYVNLDPTAIFNWSYSPALLLPLLGIGLWGAFWFTDRGWFHKLLKGAVAEGSAQEKILTASGITTNLGGNISKESPMVINGREVHSTQKLDLFYGFGVLLFLCLMAAIALLGPKSAEEAAPQAPPIVNNNITVLPPEGSESSATPTTGP